MIFDWSIWGGGYIRGLFIVTALVLLLPYSSALLVLT